MGPITADLAVDDNGVYVASRDHSLYLLDPAFGGLRWRARFSGPLYEPPVVTADTAFQFCAEDGLAAINTGTVGRQAARTVDFATRSEATDGQR